LDNVKVCIKNKIIKLLQNRFLHCIRKPVNEKIAKGIEKRKILSLRELFLILQQFYL